MNSYLGKSGDRIRVAASIEKADWIRQNRFGPVFVISLRDEQGNAITVFGNPSWLKWLYDVENDVFEFENLGEKICLSGTVHRHRTFRNERQTVLTRPRRIAVQAPLVERMFV